MTAAEIEKGEQVGEPYWTDADIVEASESNLYHPEDAVVRQDRRRLLVHMPADYGHSVVQRSFVDTEAEARELIEETLAEASGKRAQLPGQRLLWWVRPSTRPHNMAALLEERGFALAEEAEILGFDLLAVGGTPRHQSGRPGGRIQTWQVARSLDQMRLAHEMRVRSLGSDGPQVFDEAEAANDLRVLSWLEEEHPVDGIGPAPRIWDGQAVSIEFLAYEQNSAVATAGLTVRSKVGTFWGAATEQKHRRRGAYHRLVDARCEVARRLGATLALVKARRGTSGPLLKAAGFRRAGLQVCYALSLS